jgi:hypothetical protein
MSIKNACKLEVPITVRFSKERCISLTIGKKSFHVTRKHD